MFEIVFKNRNIWEQKLNQIAQASGLHSILIMESLPNTMKVVVANEQEVYHAGDAGPKSVQEGCHELYCERVINTGKPLFVADAKQDPEWAGNEDLVKFGLGVYLGYPLIAQQGAQQGKAVGTICALNKETFDFNVVAEQLKQLKKELEAIL